MLTFTILCVYADVRFAWSATNLIKVKGCHIFGNTGPGCSQKSDNFFFDLAIIAEFVMDMLGLFISIPLTCLVCVVTYFVYDHMRTNIYLHLEGNRVLYKNF